MRHLAGHSADVFDLGLRQLRADCGRVDGADVGDRAVLAAPVRLMLALLPPLIRVRTPRVPVRAGKHRTELI